MTLDPYAIVRAGSLYVAFIATVAIYTVRRPDRREWTGAMLAIAWNLPVLLGVNLAAARWGWWAFDARGGLLLGIPVDLYLSWVWLWGAIPALAFRSMPILAVTLLALVADLVLMPAAFPVVRLGSEWLAGEFAGLLVGLVPGQLLARWTIREERLPQRAVLQVVAFAGLTLFVLPAIVIDATGGNWLNPFHRPLWQLSLLVQVVALPGLLGLSAVQEFVQRGDGTPVPFDPPRRLVTSGLYAYVRNPMQLSGGIVLVLLGIVLHNAWVAAAGLMAHIFSLGLAGWDEDEDLRGRFGDAWIAYCRGVRNWVPGWRPWHPVDRDASRLYVEANCQMCRQVGDWIARREPKSLVIVPAATHASATLRRITYEHADGTHSCGVEAFARALEHIHLGWALAGCVLRLPGVLQTVQLLVDASGGEPRASAGGDRVPILLSRAAPDSHGPHRATDARMPRVWRARADRSR